MGAEDRPALDDRDAKVSDTDAMVDANWRDALSPRSTDATRRWVAMSAKTPRLVVVTPRALWVGIA